jgi:hypothetical protein
MKKDSVTCEVTAKTNEGDKLKEEQLSVLCEVRIQAEETVVSLSITFKHERL